MLDVDIVRETSGVHEDGEVIAQRIQVKDASYHAQESEDVDIFGDAGHSARWALENFRGS